MVTMTLQRMGLVALAGVLGLGMAGCPPLPGTGNQAQYDAGFLVGFAEDSEYWMGFDDGYDTINAGPIYYTGDEIPFLNEVSFDAGYWDGVWYAYHDGYFVNYDYAFTIGFSEGYDMAFRSTWPNFLRFDEHWELLDGGWTDGYEDGFSEGRVFGAFDYKEGLSFDWLDAMLDYRDGVDVQVVAQGRTVSTGLNGPVFLYEYGTNPFDLVKSGAKAADVPALLRKADRPVPSIRRGVATDGAKAEIPAISYRDLTPDRRANFNVVPTVTPRSDETLTLQTSWLQRVNAYVNASKSNEAKSASPRRVSAE